MSEAIRAARTAKRRRGRVLWSLTLICALAYLPSLRHITTGAWPFSEDAMAAFGIWREFTRMALARGILPLWNPHLFCGMPFISNGQTSIFYPPNLIYWFLPIRLALLLDAFGHNVLLAFGAYALARALRLSRTAAWFVAVSMALSGFVMGHIFNGHMTWHAARAYLPWELWALLCYLRTGQRRYAYAWVVCFALQFLSGYPPLVVLSVGWCGGLVLAWLMTRMWSRRQALVASSLPALPAGWPQTACISGALAGLLAAVCLLPLREVSRLSVHGQALPYALASTNSGNWHSLARFIVPDFFGNNQPLQWSIFAWPHEEAAYCGLLAIVLALGAPLLAGRSLRAATTSSPPCSAMPYLPRAVLWLWPLVPATALIAMGDNTAFYPWLFQHVGLLRLMRVPSRWLETGAFAAIFLAGFSFDGCLHRIPAEQGKNGARWLALWFAALTSLLLGIWLFVSASASNSPLWMQTAQWNWPRDGAAQSAAAQVLREVALQAVLNSCLIALATTILLALWLANFAALRRCRVEKLLLGLVVVDMFGLFWRSDKFITPQTLHDVVLWPPRLTRLYHLGERWNTRVPSLEAMDQAMPLGIDLMNGYDTMGTRRYFQFATVCEGRDFWTSAYEPDPVSLLWRVTGLTQTLIQKTSSFGVSTWKLRPYSGAWPRVYLARRILRRPEAAQLKTLGALARQPFATRNPAVVVAPGVFANIDAQPLVQDERVTNWRRDLNEMQIETRTHAPTVLAQSEAWYPGWRAWVNGREVSLARVNFMFRGVVVPAGRAQVRVVYVPATYRVGLFLSLCGLAALAAMGVGYIKGGRQDRV